MNLHTYLTQQGWNLARGIMVVCVLALGYKYALGPLWAYQERLQRESSKLENALQAAQAVDQELELWESRRENLNTVQARLAAYQTPQNFGPQNIRSLLSQGQISVEQLQLADDSVWQVARMALKGHPDSILAKMIEVEIQMPWIHLDRYRLEIYQGAFVARDLEYKWKRQKP